MTTTKRTAVWRTRTAVLSAALLVAVVGAAVTVIVLTSDDDSQPPPPVGGAGPASLVAVGDIARCGDDGDEATARLVEQEPEAVLLALGDIAYSDGSAEDFRECYDPNWGQFLPRTYPVPGNHEYHTEGASAYFDYFDGRAGTPGEGWYSFAIGKWHVVALNSNCRKIDCGPTSPQVRWLQQDLEQADSLCTLAFWHHPRFSSGERHAGTKSVEALWQTLLEHRVELVLSGHEHLYERTAPLDADGEVDPENGVRQFVVGTGGGTPYELGPRIPGSEAVQAGAFGVLRMELDEDGYSWTFLPTRDDVPGDSGSADCR